MGLMVVLVIRLPSGPRSRIRRTAFAGEERRRFLTKDMAPNLPEHLVAGTDLSYPLAVKESSRSPAKFAAFTSLIVFISVGTSQAASEPRYSFSNVTKASGISTAKTMTFGQSWVDYDRDGDPDLLANRHWKAAHFYRNSGSGHYLKLPVGFIPSHDVDRHGCAWGEANGDGRPDLYCTQGADRGMGEGANQLLVQTRRGSLRDRAYQFGVQDRYGRGRVAHWLDFDSDRDLDLFVLNAPRRGTSSVMFRNDRGPFKRVSVGLDPPVGEWPSSAWSDWDGDGDPDLLVFGRGHAGVVAYRNSGGRFTRIDVPGVTGTSYRMGAFGDYDGDGRPDLVLVATRSLAVFANAEGTFHKMYRRSLDEGRMATWFDAENDGDLDLFVVQGAPQSALDSDQGNRPDLLLINTGSTFGRIRNHTIRGPRSGNGDSVSIGDTDRDGRLDLFVGNGHNPSAWEGRNTLIRNRSAVGRWVRLRLQGRRWNPYGIGSRIRVITRRFAYEREITDGVAYRQQSDIGVIHLGIRRARRAQIVVRWSGGGRDCVRIAAGRTRVVRMGSRPC